MKEEGASGAAIIGALVENSATFALKTKFSQEKYLLRKQRKHVTRFRVLRPNAPLIVDELVHRNADKTW